MFTRIFRPKSGPSLTVAFERRCWTCVKNCEEFMWHFEYNECLNKLLYTWLSQIWKKLYYGNHIADDFTKEHEQFIVNSLFVEKIKPNWFQTRKKFDCEKRCHQRTKSIWGLRFITVCRLSLCSSEDINIMDIPLSVRKTFRRPLFSNLVQVGESICTKLIYFCYVYSIFVFWRYVLQKLRLFYFQWN